MGDSESELYYVLDLVNSVGDRSENNASVRFS